MATSERTFDRGTRRGEQSMRNVAGEFRDARMALCVSQQHVADAAHVSRPVYSRIERGKYPDLSIVLASQIASVLGLDLSVRVYVGGNPLRDAAHGERLLRILRHVAPPLSYRIEVPLRPTTEHLEQRSWDAMLFGLSRRTAIELEMRLYDAQAQIRRLLLKRRDDEPDNLLLVVADTRANRRVLREFAHLFVEMPKLRTADVLKAVQAGQHPPSGVVLI